MQYASVIVDRNLKNSRSLTYSIPASLLPEIKIGSLVDVPVRGKPVRGVIENLINRLPEGIKTVDMLKIRSTGCVITRRQLNLYSKFAELTASSLADVLFYFLPPKVKTVNCDRDFNIKSKSTGQLKFVYGTTLERFESYLKIIQRFNRSFVIVFPDKTSLQAFSQILLDPHIILTGEDSPSKRWKTWSIINQEKSIILTTRAGIGLWPDFDHILIIDQPAHPGQKEDRRPKFYIQEMLPALLKSGQKIIVGQDLPNLFFRHHLNQISKINSSSPVLVTGIKDNLEYLSEAVTSGKRTLIALPQKGEWAVLICRACGELLRCQNCDRSLSQESENHFICRRCFKRTVGSSPCKKCGSIDYKEYAPGGTLVERKLTQLIPSNEIVRYDLSVENINAKKIDSSRIVIATQRIFDLPVNKFDQVICLGFDPLLDIAETSQEEDVALSIIRFLSLGETSKILTSRPEHRIYKYLGEGRSNQLFDELLKERSTIWPPVSRLVNLSFDDKYSTTIMKSIANLALSKMPIESTNNRQIIQISVARKSWRELLDLFDQFKDKITIDPDPR